MTETTETQSTYNFILDENHELVAEPDMEKWGDWWRANRLLVDEKFLPDIRVATIFLGRDQQLGFFEVPAYFETTVFRAGVAQEDRQYPTYADAMKGHRELVDKWKLGK